jgi:hypothetical protein
MKTRPPRNKTPDARIAASHRVSASEAYHSKPTAQTEPQPAPAGNPSPCPGGEVQATAPGKLLVRTSNRALADQLARLAFARLERTVQVVTTRYELTVDVLKAGTVGRGVLKDLLLKGVVRL